MFTPLKGRSQGSSMDEVHQAASPAPDAASAGSVVLSSTIPKRVGFAAYFKLCCAVLCCARSVVLCCAVPCHTSPAAAWAATTSHVLTLTPKHCNCQQVQQQD